MSGQVPFSCIQRPPTAPPACRQPAARHPSLVSPVSARGPVLRPPVCAHVRLSITCQRHCLLPEPRENKLWHPDPSPAAVPRSPRTTESAHSL